MSAECRPHHCRFNRNPARHLGDRVQLAAQLEHVLLRRQPRRPLLVQLGSGLPRGPGRGRAGIEATAVRRGARREARASSGPPHPSQRTQSARSQPAGALRCFNTGMHPVCSHSMVIIAPARAPGWMPPGPGSSRRAHPGSRPPAWQPAHGLAAGEALFSGRCRQCGRPRMESRAARCDRQAKLEIQKAPSTTGAGALRLTAAAASSRAARSASAACRALPRSTCGRGGEHSNRLSTVCARCLVPARACTLPAHRTAARPPPLRTAAAAAPQSSRTSPQNGSHTPRPPPPRRSSA